MSTTVNPEIAALRDKIEEHGKELAEIQSSLNRLIKTVRASVCQAIWQSIALFISLCVTIVGGLAYQTSVLNNRFEQIEKGREESDKRFAERSKLSEENLKTHLEQSERNRTARFGNLKQEVRARRK
jgi:F0F1-type ATP synthase membrane subunit b/b'